MSRGPRLRQTHNYLWSEEDALGRGAAGQVYVAYCKSANSVNHKGEKVAVKVLTEHRSMQRETEALKRLTKHKNIVTFYGTEQEGYNTVLIMELCNAGSLYEVIESPEHSHGLDEKQFKIVLIDIAEGLHHLKQQNFAHRDIKPGNIMRCQLSDGSYRFKLADFGAARNIDPEDEAPKSIVGTVEYLHPDIYDSYLKHHQRSRYKSSEADLWSVGATYYHAATGMVPFRAYRSRGDDQTMVRIIKDKPSGAVTGWQERDGGSIKYSNELPRATLISQGLKDLITPLIAGLLEVNTGKAWKFDRFFREVKRITEMKVVDVFCISHCSCHKIYIDRKLPNGVQRLKDSFNAQTKLNPRHTELFYENLPYAHGANPIPVDRLPQTTPYKPITFFGGEPQKADRLEQPPLLNHNFPHSDDIVRYTKECLKTLWGFQYSSEMLDCCFQMMHQSAHCLSETIHQEYTIIAQQADSLMEFHEALCWILRNQESQLVNDIAVLDLHKITNERGCGDLLYRMQNELSQKRERIKMYEGRRESILSHLRQAHAQSNGIRVQWDSKLHTEIFSEGVEKVAFFVQTVKKLLSEAESLQRKPTSREHNQLVTEHISAQLSDTYATGQEKILEMQEIRSDVHNKLYVFLNNCHALREEMGTFRRDLENDKAECKNDMKRLQEWIDLHRQRMFSVKTMIKEKLNNASHSSSSSTQLKTPEMRRILDRLATCTTSMNQLAFQQRTILSKLN